MSAKLTASVLVSALLRQAAAEGGFGTLLQRGDEHAGSVLVLLLERGEPKLLLERVLQDGEAYAWRDMLATSNDQTVSDLIERRRRFDPDLWVVELDILSSERFAAAMNGFD